MTPPDGLLGRISGLTREPGPDRITIDREPDYLHDEHTLRSWLGTTDHKRIGILYLLTITFFFVIGALAAGGVRLSLIVPNGAIFSNDTYNKLFTIHGVVMVWFFLIPSIPSTGSDDNCQIQYKALMYKSMIAAQT